MGSIVIKERKRTTHLQITVRRHKWKMEGQLHKIYNDTDYVKHLMTIKKNNRDTWRKNPDAPDQDKWIQVKIFEDELEDIKSVVDETQWELQAPVNAKTTEEAGIVTAGIAALGGMTPGEVAATGEETGRCRGATENPTRATLLVGDGRCY